MGLVGGDTELAWPWIMGWMLAAALLAWGVLGWHRGRKDAAHLGFPPGTYLFATDLIDARDGVCTIYNLDAVTDLRAKAVHEGTKISDSVIEFVFGHDVVDIRVLGKQTAQLTINKFWPAREALLTAEGAAEWDAVAELDPLYEPRRMGGWEQVCRPPAAPSTAHTIIGSNAGRGPLGLHPSVVRVGTIAAVVAAPVLWFASNLGHDALAFSRARSRDTVAAWKEYLNRDNPRHYYEAKNIHLPQAALRAAAKEDTATALRNFLAKYGDSSAAPEAERALHERYERAVLRVKAEVSEPARDATISLLRWLDRNHTNLVEVRFGASSAVLMSAIDDFIGDLFIEQRLSVPIAPVGPSLAPEIMARRQTELIAEVRKGFASIVSSDLAEFKYGGEFSGLVAALDRAALTVTCYAETSPQAILDRASRKYYLRLAFNVEFNLYVPEFKPYTSSFQVSFVDKLPKPHGKENLYDGMLAFTFEEVEHNIAESLFPKHLPERKVEMAETAAAPPETSGPMFTATGFCVSPDGYIATAHHFTSKAKTYKVVTAGGKVDAQLVTSDPENDLAILKIPAGLPTSLALRPSANVKLGESVATIGFPQTDLQGRSPKIGKGEIASLAGMRDDPNMFQTSVPIQPGNSGGPLLDLSGNVVGVIVSSLIRGQSVNYAVKSAYLAKLCSRIPELRTLPGPSTAGPPAFEDMIERVQQATVLIEGYQ